MDFSRLKTPPTPISIEGVEVDSVQDYEWAYSWTTSRTGLRTPRLCTGRTRGDFMRRLWSFNVRSTMLSWGSRVRAADANRIYKLIRKAGSLLEVELNTLVVESEMRMLCKLRSIMDNDSLWRARTGAPSPTDSYHHDAPWNATGNPSFLWQSTFTAHLPHVETWTAEACGANVAPASISYLFCSVRLVSLFVWITVYQLITIITTFRLVGNYGT